MGLDLGNIFQINTMCSKIENKNSTLQVIISLYKPLSQNIIGKIKNIQAWLWLKYSATSIFAKCRPLPFARHDRVKDELNLLIEQDIIEPVNIRECATTIVPVVLIKWANSYSWGL